MIPVSTGLLHCNSRYDSLDIWRGLACIAVVIYHASFLATSPPSLSVFDPFSSAIWFAHRLWIGVPMFFVISGYCISATAESTINRNQSVLTYFLRRFRRIFPTFWVFLFVTAVLYFIALALNKEWLFTGMGASPESMSVFSWLGQLTLTESWLPKLFGHNRSYFVNHAWTLCYEEQFYFVVGVVLLFSPRHFFIGALVISLACIACMVAFGSTVKGFFFDGYWLLFAAGILVYYSTNHCERRTQFLHMVALGAVAFMTSLREPLFVEHGAAGKLSSEHFFVGALFGCLLVGLRPFDKKVNALFFLRPFRLCGILCYSLYLVHWPITLAIMLFLAGRGIKGDFLTVTVTIPTCVIASVGVAILFHQSIEKRFLNRPLRDPNISNSNTSVDKATFQTASS